MQPIRIVSTTEELIELIAQEMALHGVGCDLNHLDISRLDTLNGVFQASPFNGDISKWDVSNIVQMDHLFEGSMFNGDISEWNVSKVTAMSSMFKNSVFNGNISKWDTKSLRMTHNMFYGSQFNGDIASWNMDTAFSTGLTDGMFNHCAYAGDLSHWTVHSTRMVGHCFSPEFKGKLPRSAQPICKEFYAALFGSAQKLHRYLRKQPFGGAHFDVLRLAPQRPEWARTQDYKWARTQDYKWAQQIAKMGLGIGMDDDSLRAYAIAQYGSPVPSDTSFVVDSSVFSLD